jgi:hypothetical protein
MWATASLKQIAWEIEPVLWIARHYTSVDRTLHSQCCGNLKSKKCVYVCVDFLFCTVHISPMLHFTTRSQFCSGIPSPSFGNPRKTYFRLLLENHPLTLAHWEVSCIGYYLLKQKTTFWLCKFVCYNFWDGI